MKKRGGINYNGHIPIFQKVREETTENREVFLSLAQDREEKSRAARECGCSLEEFQSAALRRTELIFSEHRGS